jgi:peptidoglycan/LPS O-acetylase OafA/YrhL
MADGSAGKVIESEVTVTTKKMTSARVRLGVAVLALAFYAAFIFRTSLVIAGTRYFVLFEDAMISMRYARHLADGHGLVWNIGEPPIEGFTNLLWVLWMAAAHKLGLSESKISLFIMLSGVAILMTTGMLASRIAKKMSSAPWVPLVALAATLFCYPLVFWTLRGMEVGAMTLTVYALVWLVLENEDDFSLGQTVAMGAITAAALLIRSDSAVPVALISLYGFLTGGKKRWLFAGVIGAFGGAAVGGQMAFRRAYFHDSMPNTYYLKLYKIHTSERVKRGAFVALEVLTMYLAVPLAVIAGALKLDRFERSVKGVLAFWADKTNRRCLLLASLFAAQVAYATYVGGDAWEWMMYANRYTTAGMPALIVLVAVLAERVIASKADHATVAKRFAYGLVVCGGVLVAINLYARVRPEGGIAATITFSKTPAAIGGALVLAGLLLRLRDARTGIVEGLAWLESRLASQQTVTIGALIVAVLVWLPVQALPMARWAAQNAAQYNDEARYTRTGLLIQAETKPDFRIAVAAAGATPYFAQRPTEDLLGKNDKYIAHLAPRGVFSPGHDKWDYSYSLGQHQAQLVVETVDVNDADEAYMKELGFEELKNGMRLREDAPVKDRALFGLDQSDNENITETLGSLGYQLPPSFSGIDLGIILLFGFVSAAAARRIVKDEDVYDDLQLGAPADPGELDAGQKQAIAGADTHAIPTLDGMRGIAVLTVLMFHFAWTFPGDDPTTATTLMEKVAVQLHAFMWSGWTGVDLFFVLSGYLITRGLVTDSKKPLGTRLKMFWMRRVLRIFPLYYAVLIVGTVVTVGFLGAKWIPELPYWIYFQNYSLAFDHVIMRWTAHFWSLAIEEQFYFVWPLVALLTPRRKLIPVILGLIVFTVGLRGALTFKGEHLSIFQHWYANEPDGGIEHGIAKFVYRCTFTRADGLLLGAFVAVTQREVRHPISQVWRRVRLPIFIGTAAALLGLYVWATGLNDYDRRVIGVGYFMLALFFASGVSLCADHVIEPRTTGILSSRPLVACGKVSYGMYIFHWPLVVVSVPYLMKWQAGQSTAMQMAISGGFVVAGILFIYAVATVSFRFFETPFLTLKKKFHG